MSWHLGASCEEEGEEENFATPFPIPEHTFTVYRELKWIGTGGIMLEPAHIFTYWSACYVLKICNEILMFLVF